MTFSINGSTYDALNPFVIAEIGVNHEGSLASAKKHIDAAKRGGAHAVKFQTYTADKLAAKLHAPAYWDTNKEPTSNQHELFSRYESFNFADYKLLSEYAMESGLVFMTTVFDIDQIEEFDSLLSIHKIASADLTNLPLLDAIARTRKPVILSVGASTADEISTAVKRLFAGGSDLIALLHCVLRYPTPLEDANLGAILDLKNKFGSSNVIGYSDHVAPVGSNLPSLQIASILGAEILEKHFTLDRNAPGNDHYHAASEAELSQFSRWLAEAKLLFGSREVSIKNQSLARENARRRIFSKKLIPKGSKIDADSLIPLRANVGIEVIFWDDVIGEKTKAHVSPGEPIEWEMLEGEANSIS